jgi:hypothetical protein
MLQYPACSVSTDERCVDASQRTGYLGLIDVGFARSAASSAFL